MTPKTLKANLLAYGGAIALALLISFLTSLSRELPGDDPIHWRTITLDVVLSLLNVLPAIGLTAALPRVGREPVAALADKVGPAKAKAVLKKEVDRQEEK